MAGQVVENVATHASWGKASPLRILSVQGEHVTSTSQGPQSSLVLLQIGIRCDSCRTAAEHHPAINLIPPRGRWAAPMMKLKVVFSH